MDPLLCVRDVTKTYRNGANSFTAVNHVSLEVQPGEVTLILGPSGSGKTTLLSIMGGLLRPTAGQVLVGGKDACRLSDRALSKLRRKQIGFVFQSFNLLRFLTVRQNVEVALNLIGVSGREARTRTEEMLHQVGLGHRLGFAPAKLSGGERQRVSIARALVGNPQIVLADEPTGNLDSRTGHIVVELMTGLAREQGSGVVIVTHDDRIADVADRVLQLADGMLK
jgi:putative ABC transport system ATP-binding protein